MMRLVSPAPLAEVLALFAADPIAPSLMKFGRNPLAVIIAHIAAGRSWLAVDEAGRALGAMGLILDRDRVFETWFVCRPEASRRILGMMRAAQLTWRALAQDGPVEIRAHVAPHWLPGQRLARALGMRSAGVSAGMQVWEIAL